ncbi:hypothetical protein [Streptomyces sp. NPDC008139]|uniref:hypothetical protein n=1 Tax=Streptomyces sp. NPDC008139 TaxID=3364814 RepID=UPI0036E2B765
MTKRDIETLKQRYLSALRAFAEAVKRSHAALGEVKPLGGGPTPEISGEWKAARQAEVEAQAAYVAARDAYFAALDDQ